MEEEKGRKLFAGIAFVFLTVIILSVFYLFGMDKNSADAAFAFVAGISMIILPCTLPLAFIIVPLSMGKGYRKGFKMALSFGLGLALTITFYGIFVAIAGSILGLDSAAAKAGIFSKVLFMIGGFAAFIFGLSELKLINFKMPSFAKTPKFIENRKDISKAFFLGLFLGNAGVGCPNPLFYVLLGDIAIKGSILTGAWLGFIHGLGRATPLIFLSILGILGINATTSIIKHQKRIKAISGWFLIILGAIIFIIGGAHSWYENTIVHSGWNKVINVTGLPSELMGKKHEEVNSDLIPSWLASWTLLGLIVIPLGWWYYRKRKENEG